MFRQQLELKPTNLLFIYWPLVIILHHCRASDSPIAPESLSFSPLSLLSSSELPKFSKSVIDSSVS